MEGSSTLVFNFVCVRNICSICDGTHHVAVWYYRLSQSRLVLGTIWRQTYLLIYVYVRLCTLVTAYFVRCGLYAGFGNLVLSVYTGHCAIVRLSAGGPLNC